MFIIDNRNNTINSEYQMSDHKQEVLDPSSIITYFKLAFLVILLKLFYF